MAWQCKDPTRVRQLLGTVHCKYVLPGLNHPAISQGERERVATLYNQAFSACGAPEIRAYWDVASDRLGDACAENHRDFAQPLMDEIRSLFEEISAQAETVEVEALTIYQPPHRAPGNEIEAAYYSDADLIDDHSPLGPRLRAILASISQLRGRIVSEMGTGIQPETGQNFLSLIDPITRSIADVSDTIFARPVSDRIVLADANGNLFDRAACPGQVWPTPNPFQALNWPDLPTALATITGPTHGRAYRDAKNQSYVLKRARLVVEDLAPGEIEGAISRLADREAVAG